MFDYPNKIRPLAILIGCEDVPLCRPERNVVSHQPLLPGRTVGNFGSRGPFKRQVPAQQPFQRDANVNKK